MSIAMKRLSTAVVVGAVLAGLAGSAMAQDVDERDHVWVVDGAGRPTPLYGCWKLTSFTSPLSDNEIGQELFISPRTVQNHLTRIREKTGLRRRSELTRWAVEHAIG